MTTEAEQLLREARDWLGKPRPKGWKIREFQDRLDAYLSRPEPSAEEVREADEQARRLREAEADLDILCTVIRTGAVPSERRQWTNDIYRKTALRAIELDQIRQASMRWYECLTAPPIAKVIDPYSEAFAALRAACERYAQENQPAAANP